MGNQARHEDETRRQVRQILGGENGEVQRLAQEASRSRGRDQPK